MKKIFFYILGILTVFAIETGAQLVAPPELQELPITLQYYLGELYRNHNKAMIFTTNPDGSRNGKKGDFVLLITGGNYYLEFNIDSSTTWRGVNLTDIP